MTSQLGNKITILPRKRSGAEEFVSAFNQGPSVNELLKPYREDQQKKSEKKNKLKDYHERSGRSRLLKMYRDPTKVDEKTLFKAHQRAGKLLDAGIPEEQAYQLAITPDDELPINFRQLLGEDEDLALTEDRELTTEEQRQKAYEEGPSLFRKKEDFDTRRQKQIEERQKIYEEGPSLLRGGS